MEKEKVVDLAREFFAGLGDEEYIELLSDVMAELIRSGYDV